MFKFHICFTFLPQKRGRNVRAGQRTENSMQGMQGTGNTCLSPGASLVALLHNPQLADNCEEQDHQPHLAPHREIQKSKSDEREEGLLLSQGTEEWLAKPTLPLPPTPPLMTEVRVPLLERRGKAVKTLGKNLSCLFLLLSTPTQPGQNSSKKQRIGTGNEYIMFFQSIT